MTTSPTSEQETRQEIIDLMDEIGGGEVGTTDSALDTLVKQILAGELTMDELRDALNAQMVTYDTLTNPNNTMVQGVVLPSDVNRLLKVAGEGGIADEYYVQGTVMGKTFSFLIGDQAAFDAMFPSGAVGFASFETMTRSEFTNSDLFAYVAGTIDQIQGSTESLQGQFQRDLDALGLEGVPTWVRDDPQAMLTLATANAQGWSDARLQEAMSKTAGFRNRFVGFDQWYNEEEHGAIGDAVSKWLKLESEFTDSLRSLRGRDTDTSTKYLGSLITSGWGVGEFTQLLSGEQQVRSNAAAMQNLNEILAFQGKKTLSVDEMVDYFIKQDEFEGFELINDALRATALEEQGIDLSPEQYAALGEGSSLGVQSVGAFSEQARTAALGIAANFDEIQRGKLGVSNEMIVAVAFQDPDLLPKETSLAQAELLLQKLGRERNALAGGTGGPTAFQDDQGRLRIQGLAG